MGLFIGGLKRTSSFFCKNQLTTNYQNG